MEKVPGDKQRPFAGELEKSPLDKGGFWGRERLYDLEGHPNVLIRLGRILNASNSEELTKQITKLKKNKELFSSLEKDGMNVVQMDYVVGGEKDEHDRAESYAVVEKIDGKNLLKIEHFDSQMMEKIDQCYASYFEHIQRILREGGQYWYDMNMENVVYGTREGDTVPKVYLVDVGPHFYPLMSENDRNNNSPGAVSEIDEFIRKLKFSLTDFTEIERKAENNIRLNAAREKLQAILATLNPFVAAHKEEYFSKIRRNFSELQAQVNAEQG